MAGFAPEYAPSEVFNGAKPDKTLFKNQIEQAKILRIAENRALSCDSCAFVVENEEKNQA